MLLLPLGPHQPSGPTPDATRSTQMGFETLPNLRKTSNTVFGLGLEFRFGVPDAACAADHCPLCKRGLLVHRICNLT